MSLKPASAIAKFYLPPVLDSLRAQPFEFAFANRTARENTENYRQARISASNDFRKHYVFEAVFD